MLSVSVRVNDFEDEAGCDIQMLSSMKRRPGRIATNAPGHGQ
jgi:hypothetical protein